MTAPTIEPVKADKQPSDPYVGFLDLRALDVLTTSRQLRLAIALRSYPSSRGDEVFASWEGLGRRSRLITPSGHVRNVRLVAAQLRDLGLLTWERRPWETNKFTLLGVLAERPVQSDADAGDQSDADRQGAGSDQSDADTSRQTDADISASDRRTKSPTSPPTDTDDDVGRVDVTNNSPSVSPPLRGEPEGFSDEAVELAFEEALVGAALPEPVSEAEAAERPVPDDETVPEDLRRRKFTYVASVTPTKSKDNQYHKIAVGSGKMMLIENPVIAKRLKAREGKLVYPFTRLGDRKDMLIVTDFRDAPTPEERRGELWKILVAALQGREDASSLDDLAFDDPIFPGFADKLNPGKIIAWVRGQALPESREETS